jgi:hypothetical protein
MGVEMKGYIFTLEVLIAVAIVIIALSILDVSYEPKKELALHKIAEDSLAILKKSGGLKSNNTVKIEEILNYTSPHYHLEIYQFDQSAILQGHWGFGETVGEESIVAKATWVSDEYFYLAILEVWQ